MALDQQNHIEFIVFNGINYCEFSIQSYNHWPFQYLFGFLHNVTDLYIYALIIISFYRLSRYFIITHSFLSFTPPINENNLIPANMIFIHKFFFEDFCDYNIFFFGLQLKLISLYWCFDCKILYTAK